MARTNDLQERSSARPSEAGSWRRYLPLALILIAPVAMYALDVQMYLSFETLKSNRALLADLLERHYVPAMLAFLVVYATATALSFPGGAVLSITGGFLFGGWQGGIIVVVGATIGATAVFLIARSAFGDRLHRRAGPWLEKMEAGFRSNAFSYLLTLRLIPIYPFFAVNLIPAFLAVRLATYVLATAVGIVPGTLVFTYAGAGLGSVFDSGERFSVASVLSPEILLALTGLGVLALLAPIYTRWKRPSRSEHARSDKEGPGRPG